MKAKLMVNGETKNFTEIDISNIANWVLSNKEGWAIGYGLTKDSSDAEVLAKVIEEGLESIGYPNL